jgi:hypothetical protein
MQILTTKNQNLEKPFRNPSNRTIVKILGKNFFWISLKKIWFRVCSATAEMFELRNSGENRRKRSEFFSKIYQGHIRIWFRSKKKFKNISCLCTFKNFTSTQREALRITVSKIHFWGGGGGYYSWMTCWKNPKNLQVTCSVQTTLLILCRQPKYRWELSHCLKRFMESRFLPFALLAAKIYNTVVSIQASHKVGGRHWFV